MSSYNIELVHIILKAVCEHTVGTPKSKDERNYKVYQGYDFKNKNTFTIDCVQIANFKQWDIEKVTLNDETKVKKEMVRRVTADGDGPDVKEALTINEDIEVTEYAPDVFSFLRQKDGFENEDLALSLNPESNKDKVFKAGESQGKSGSFFFFSDDQRFIIKTMTDSDFNAFMRLFRSYFRHICSQKKNSTK
jgi:hypothetical protein